jgi:multicomponent Na+:H+ antiporter subunit B
MSPSFRRLLVLAGGAGLALLLGWAIAGLPSFGHYHGPYGTILDRVAVPERHATNVVSAVNFDYRGFDTLGEELILFTSSVAVAMLLREQRGERERAPTDAEDRRRIPETADAVRALGLLLVGPLVVFGLYVVSHGHLTPGGGFQGGVLLAAALFSVFLSDQYVTLKRVEPWAAIEIAGSVGAGAYAAMGVGALAAGGAFLENLLPLGRTGNLLSAGNVFVLNLAVGLEVAAAFVLILSEYLEQALAVRGPAHRRREV